MLANYHTHTRRCNHATGTEREYIENAIAQGFQVLGFSDHVPQPYPAGFRSGIRMDMREIPDYTETLVKLRDEYKDQIQILIGYEVEYSKRFFPKLLEELRKYPLDYMILGQHFAVNEVDGFYVGSPIFGEDQLQSYVETTIEGMETGLFTYLAHPDLVYYMGGDEVYLRHMRRIVRKSIELSIPLEVNMYGFLDGRHYPCDRFFRMASEMGAKFVLGCDAHQPRMVRQPDDPRLQLFLKKYGIDCGDNILEIRDPKA
ncbi:MAG: histidinol-phosphatase [Clostridiales bacterium]|nr:histidinol-phosphatase [Clostridiales bacterium]